MPVIVDGDHLTIEDVVRVARGHEPIDIPDEVMKRIIENRAIVDKKVEEREVMYGVTTGIGEFSEVVLTPEQTRQFQKYLIYSHAAGCGDPVPVEAVRAALLSRINVLCNGRSGVRPVVVRTMMEMLNRGVSPVMCQRGSVGACGDLSPMSQMALVPMGEGEAFYEGERMSGKEAMEKAGIPIIQYEARDGLASINGSNVITGMGSLQMYDAEKWIKTSEIAAAMTLNALNANMLAFDERIHRARGHRGSIVSAENIRRIVEGSDFLTEKGKRVQDAYSLRSTPQVVGAAKDTLVFCMETFHTELNGVCDNPIFFPDDGGTVITGANFQGTPLAFALEFLGTAVTTISVLSERRTNRLLNPALSGGLPAFLTRGAGMFAGLMLTQYTAGQLISENRVLSHPAATGSIPAAADQEDFVSMGMTTAIKTRQIIENASTVVAIELMAAAQALDFRTSWKHGPGIRAAYDTIRKHVDHLEEDRPLFDDINTLSTAVKSGEILEAVEKAIGSLS